MMSISSRRAAEEDTTGKSEQNGEPKGAAEEDKISAQHHRRVYKENLLKSVYIFSRFLYIISFDCFFSNLFFAVGFLGHIPYVFFVFHLTITEPARALKARVNDAGGGCGGAKKAGGGGKRRGRLREAPPPPPWKE